MAKGGKSSGKKSASGKKKLKDVPPKPMSTRMITGGRRISIS